MLTKQIIAFELAESDHSIFEIKFEVIHPKLIRHEFVSRALKGKAHEEGIASHFLDFS